eukprot:CAMPEP_0179055812 /NCGR_PEP_ID=MMETSP0796-20121207/23493_1 /TAXON_ID=73915 /ORGANISM="Pyrodinium bahamense, Strain pbaha01" /LENGTH=490 /DNA_ID=CAMNT_0020752475 /DNA_START=33 /DNA_END=1505 /DNA_ORIENTATION=+
MSAKMPAANGIAVSPSRRVSGPGAASPAAVPGGADFGWALLHGVLGGMGAGGSPASNASRSSSSSPAGGGPASGGPSEAGLALIQSAFAGLGTADASATPLLSNPGPGGMWAAQAELAEHGYRNTTRSPAACPSSVAALGNLLMGCGARGSGSVDLPLRLFSKTGAGRLPHGSGGGYDWIRSANGPEDRSRRREAIEHTLSACEAGGFTLDSQYVPLCGVKELQAQTQIVRAQEAQAAGNGSRTSATTAWFRHTPNSLVEVATERHRAGLAVALVSAGSAYSVGGGVLRGSRHALEESLCTRSTLFKSLSVAKNLARQQRVRPPATCVPACGPDGAPWECHIPEDGVVLSPGVEFFRGPTSDGYPFRCSAERVAAVVTVAMPNKSSKVKDAPVDTPAGRSEYLALLARKFAAVLAAVRARASVLVVPDIGCGIFGNDPGDVGQAFGEAVNKGFSQTFAEIHLVGQPAFMEAAESAGKNGGFWGTWSLMGH